MQTGTVRSRLDATREYVRRGWTVVPIPRGEKGPRIAGWPSLRLGEAGLAAHFHDGENVGVILGSPSRGLVDVDLDCGETMAVADYFLPPTGVEFGRPSKPRSHRLYVCEPLNALSRPRPRKFSAPDGSTIIEFRADGQQTVFPPSIHPSQEVYEFASDGDLALVGAEAISRAVARTAAAALLARHWPEPGHRHDGANALAGMLLRADWTEQDVCHFVEAVALAAGDEETRQRVRDVISTAKRLAAGQAATGAPTLAQIVGDEIVARLREWLGPYKSYPVAATGSGAWSDPSPLGDELPPVPPFDPELLPSSFRALVEDISDRTQAPPDYAAAAVIVALAGCVSRRAVIIPKQADTSWRVIPNLWGAIVAPPGMMKSPILRAVTLPLSLIEERWRAEFDDAKTAFETEKEQAELQWQAWREQYKQAIKRQDALPPQPDRILSEPLQKRLILTDATFEKLHAILAENPAGVLVIRDELTGWLSELGRLGREGERAFFLQAWNGDAGFTVDRIGRGSVHVPAVCVSLLGNIQPARLRSYLSEAVEGGPTDDGLFQRFQILVWPDLPRGWKLVDRPADEGASRVVERIFDALAELSSDTPLVLRFAPDAQALFFDWWTELESKIRDDSGLAPALVAHLAKYRSLMPSLAGLFELADSAGDSEALGEEMEISLNHTRQAAALCDYLEGHARRVYACAISPETHSARELARHIQAGDLPSPFTTRAVYLKGWAGLNTPERVRAALALLEEAAWVTRAETPPSAVGGRPSEVWIANPKGGKHRAE